MTCDTDTNKTQHTKTENSNNTRETAMAQQEEPNTNIADIDTDMASQYKSFLHSSQTSQPNRGEK